MLISRQWVWRITLAAIFGLGTPARSQDDAASRRAAIEGMYPVMRAALQAKNFGRARNICDQAIMWEPQNPIHHYNLACIEAQAGGRRLPYAWGALELSIALGFNDTDFLQTDPDLAPLRGESKFADLVRKAIFNATASGAISSLAIPTKPQTTAVPTKESELTATARFENDRPVGLFLFTRYVSSGPTVENSVWYFAEDQSVYRNLSEGFSEADLAAHAGPRGTARRSGRTLEISWADGSKSASELERDGAGFQWEMGIFTPITAFENGQELVGVYEGSMSLPSGSHDVPVAERLELREDGTFTWSGVSLTGGKDGARIIRSSSEVSSGQWEMSRFSLILRTPAGLTLRQLAFPQDDEKTVIRPDRLYFVGVVYKRRP